MTNKMRVDKETRHGTEVDVEKIKQTFTKQGFLVRVSHAYLL